MRTVISSKPDPLYFLKSDLRSELEEVAGLPYKTPLVSGGAGGVETGSGGATVLLGCSAYSPGEPYVLTFPPAPELDSAFCDSETDLHAGIRSESPRRKA